MIYSGVYSLKSHFLKEYRVIVVAVLKPKDFELQRRNFIPWTLSFAPPTRPDPEGHPDKGNLNKT
jgi:hypothetical protein